MEKLTVQMFIDGELNPKDLKEQQLVDFIAEQGLEVEMARSKAETMNRICDAIEARDEVLNKQVSEFREAEANTEKEEAPAPDKEDAPEYRENGEKIRLAKDGKDYGANLLNRMRSH